MPHQYTGEIAALLTAFCWTISSLCFTSAGRSVGSLSVNLIRLLLAWAFLAAYGLIVRGLPWPTDAPAQAWLWLSVSGFVGFFLGDLCLFEAFVTIGPRLSVLLMSLSPPMAALAGMAVLGESLTLLNWIGMAVVLAGVSWVVIERPTGANGHSHATLGGITLGVLAAAGQAVGLVLAKLGMGAENYDAFASTQIRVLPGILGFVVLLGVLRRYPRVIATLCQPRNLGLITVGAFMGPFLGVSLILFSVQHISTGVAQTFAALIPVLIIPFVVILYKERVSWRATIGACVAVAGVAMLFYK